ncbi:odorant receptor 131-2-like [Betta splendens]|uniref:Odorant receptor 131-2-like n=1 Tax=Betta splendens TaxID=158456 RepID=A0A6P7P839_BETSP|nr:odorant receptor 131-2-like [Betta splendens]
MSLLLWFIYHLCFLKMSSVNQSEQQEQGAVERLLFSTATGIPCCIFLLINGTMLFTLRSKAVFRDTSRYVLLYNLLLADTAQMACSQLMYVLAACGATLTYPECGVLNLLGKLTSDISPLTLLVMSVERYVAVCFPLRHASIITSRSTGAAIGGVWAVGLLNVLTRGLLMFRFASQHLPSLQMSEVCSEVALLVEPVTNTYNNVYTYLVFVSATAAITWSYVGVMVAARSASADKASAHKARVTLLLHLVQLGFTLSSTINILIIRLLSVSFQRLVIVRIRSVLYMLNYMLPRCLISLIYGLRDQTIRPVLIYHLCCKIKLYESQVKVLGWIRNK